jgi:hypothetical protein
MTFGIVNEAWPSHLLLRHRHGFAGQRQGTASPIPRLALVTTALILEPHEASIARDREGFCKRRTIDSLSHLRRCAKITKQNRRQISPAAVR